jgi:NADH-ubiquinone oxidoreductase chain 6
MQKKMNTFMFFNLKSILIELLIINAILSAILVIISKNPVISVIFLISLVLNSALFLIIKGLPFIGISYILIYLGAIIVLFLFVIMMINVRLTDILETGTQYTKNIPLALTVSGLFLYLFLNILPSFMNSTVIPIEGSILMNLGILNKAQEIVLALNSIFNISNKNIPLLEPIKTFQSGYDLDLIVSETVLNSKNIFPIVSNNNWPETLIGSYTQIVPVAYSLYTYGAFLFLVLSFILLLAMIAPIYISRK